MNDLTALIAPELEAVNACFEAELKSELEHVNQLCTHVGKFRGKMLRPMLVLLAGRVVNPTLGTVRGKISQTHVVLATVVEMVHMATLVHDDILDGAEVRRKGATINYLHGNEAAVLLGDYLISHAYHLCSSLNEQHYARIVAHATNVICEGELTQNFNRRNWSLTEKTYFDIIYRKTAVLTETCCRLGAMAGTKDVRQIEALAQYGKNIGIAFQIIDDVLDICGTTKTVGKSLGTDIEKGKLTLPMLHFLKNAAPQHRALLVDLLESTEADRIGHVRQLLAPSPSIQAARNVAEQYIQEAIAGLQVLPTSEARETLIEMAKFVTSRDK